MREITQSVKVALKCIIAAVLVDVDLPYWTAKVEHLVAFTSIFSNICTAHAQKRLFMNFRCKVRHRRSICRPRFPIRVQNFSDLASFSIDFCILYAEFSAIFLLLVCLTYWPKKYTTHVDPYVDNSHQVWSWYDHKLPSYSVFVCRYIMWPCDLWPSDLEQLSYTAGHMTNLAPSLKTLRLFDHELQVITVPTDYHWKCICSHCACAESRDPWVGGQKQLHFWNPRPRFAYSLYNFVSAKFDWHTINLADHENPLLRASIWAVSPTQAKLQ